MKENSPVGMKSANTSVRYDFSTGGLLDDSRLGVPGDLRPELILCDGRMGLTNPQCAEIARWLALPD